MSTNSHNAVKLGSQEELIGWKRGKGVNGALTGVFQKCVGKV